MKILNSENLDAEERAALDRRFGQNALEPQKAETKLPAPDPKPIGDKNRDAGILGRIVSTISDALRPPRDPIFRLIDKVFAHDPSAAPTAGELKRIRQLQDEYQRLWEAANITFTEQAARQEFNKRQTRTGAAIRKEDTSDNAIGFETLVGEFAAKQSAARLEMKMIQSESNALARPIMERTCRAAESLHNNRKHAEAEEAAEIGYEPQHTVLIFALKRFTAALRNRLNTPDTGAGSPASQLFFIESIQPKN